MIQLGTDSGGAQLRMKMMVAAEDAAERDLIVGSLTEAETPVVCASEGAHVWELLSAKDPPRLLVVNWALLNLGGLELCRKIRKRASAEYTYIILVGLRPDKADRLAAFHAGADDYLSKPIQADDLLARIQVGRRILEKEATLSAIITGWRTMLDSLPFGVACIGTRGQLVRANTVFVELLGYDIKNLLGKSLGQTVLQEPREFSGLMDKIRRSQAFDLVRMDMVQMNGESQSYIVWGRPISNTKDIVYQIIVGLP